MHKFLVFNVIKIVCSNGILAPILLSDQAYKYKNSTFETKPYYPVLGIMPKNYDNSKPGFTIPDGCYITNFEQLLIDFICGWSELEQIMSDGLEELYAKIDWIVTRSESRLKIVSCLKYNTADIRNLVQNWLHDISNLFDRKRKDFIVENINVPQSSWHQFLSGFREFIGDIEVNNDEYSCRIIVDNNIKAKIVFDTKCFCAIVLGLNCYAEPLIVKINNLVNDVQIHFQQEKPIEKKILPPLQTHHYKLLNITGLLQKLGTQHDVKIGLNVANNSIILNGSSKNNIDVGIEIFTYLSSAFQTDIKCSANMSKLIANDHSTVETLERMLSHKDNINESILAVFYGGNDCINIIAPDKTNGLKACNIVNKAILQNVIKLTHEAHREVLRKEKWRYLENIIKLDANKDIILEYNNVLYECLTICCPNQPTVTLQVDEQCETLKFDGLAYAVKAAKDSVNTYLDNVATFTDFVLLPFDVVKYLQSDSRLDFVKGVQFQAVIDDDRVGIQVSGKRVACAAAAQTLRALADDTVANLCKTWEQNTDVLELTKANLYRNFNRFIGGRRKKCLSSNADPFIKQNIAELAGKQTVIIGKINNIANVEDEKNECIDEPRSQRLNESGIFCVNNVEIIPLICDLVTLHVDVIVNPSNEFLRLGNGVARSIKIHGQKICKVT